LLAISTESFKSISCYIIFTVCLLHVSATLTAILREVHQTKSEVTPIACIEGEQRYSCTLSLTRTLEGVGGQLCTRLFYSPRKSPVTQWALRTVWTGAENIAPNGILTPDCPDRSASLYRPRYQDPAMATNPHRKRIRQTYAPTGTLPCVLFKHVSISLPSCMGSCITLNGHTAQNYSVNRITSFLEVYK
jgi:hypothetical protein